MTRIVTYLRYQDVFGTPSALSQFEAELAALDLGLVLRVFAAINVFCSRRGLPEKERTQARLIRELFEPNTAQMIEGQSLDVFHRRQCLFVFREAVRCSPDLPEMSLTAEVLHRIGVLSLMANEHASGATTPLSVSQANIWLAQLCDFIPITEANELKFDLASISRMHKIVTHLAPARVGKSAYFDISMLFERASGLPLKIFEALMIGILPRILQSAVDLLTRSPHYGIHVDFFEQTGLETGHRDAFLQLLGRTPAEFRAKLASRSEHLNDFTTIKDAPFLKDPRLARSTRHAVLYGKVRIDSVLDYPQGTAERAERELLLLLGKSV